MLATYMGSAQQWATRDATTVTPEHLLVALAEQASRDSVSACVAAGVDLDGAREGPSLRWAGRVQRFRPWSRSTLLERWTARRFRSAISPMQLGLNCTTANDACRWLD
jgi:hypothetical protein